MKKAIVILSVVLPASCLMAFGSNGAARGEQSMARLDSKTVVLGEGKTRQLDWRINAGRGRDGSPQEPCLAEQVWLFGGYSQGVECAPPAPQGDSALFTQFSASFDRSDGKKVGASSLGFAFSTDVRRAWIDLVPGPAQTRRTRLLGGARAEQVNLSPFRYLAFGVARDVCVRKIIGFDETEQEVFRQSQSCGHQHTTVVPAQG